MFNKAKGGKIQTNKMSCKKMFWFKIQGEIWNLKKIKNQTFTTFTNKNKIHSSL
jgi:hypothetical protein